MVSESCGQHVIHRFLVARGAESQDRRNLRIRTGYIVGVRLATIVQAQLAAGLDSSAIH